MSHRHTYTNLNSPRGELWHKVASYDWYRCILTWPIITLILITTHHVTSCGTKLCTFLCLEHYSSSYALVGPSLFFFCFMWQLWLLVYEPLGPLMWIYYNVLKLETTFRNFNYIYSLQAFHLVTKRMCLLLLLLLLLLYCYHPNSIDYITTFIDWYIS